MYLSTSTYCRVNSKLSIVVQMTIKTKKKIESIKRNDTINHNVVLKF